MTPWDKAIAIYDNEPCFRTFDEDLRLHLRNGFVFSTPDFFIMGRPVDSNYPEHCVTDPAYKFASIYADCWHVHVMAGNMSKAWGILPWPLPFISFQRKNELRVYGLDRVRTLCTLPA